jgi:prephenate dehydrogenase
MAVIQVLHHHALLAFCLSLNKVAPNMGLSEYVTESLEKTLQNLESMQLNWQTISAIQKCNPYAQQIREAFAQTSNEMLSFNENSRAKLQHAISLLRSP